MKTLNYLKYFFLVVFGATLMFSCSDEDSATEGLNSQSDNITLRNSDDWDSESQDFECFVKICVEIIPATFEIPFDDLFIATVNDVDEWQVTETTFTDNQGDTGQLPSNNTYCFSVGINDVANVVLSYHGYGGVVVTAEWANGAVCQLWEAQWIGVSKNPLNSVIELELTCKSTCSPPPTCFVNTCITFIEGDASDNYLLQLPTQGFVSIANGLVTIQTNTTQDQFPLPDDGTFCVMLPVFDPVTVLVTYNGTGSVSIEGTWPGDITCELFAEGQCTNDPIHVIEEPVTISCEPPCPAPLCEIDVCITFIEGDPSDNYLLDLPTVGFVSIANGIVTIPSGCQFPLPADGTFCTTLPIFDPVTATVTYNGTGSVVIDATYDNGTTCTIFQAGVNSELNLHIIEDVTLDCDPECPVIPECYVNLCLELSDPQNDVFKVEILGVGSVQIINGTVIAPSGVFPFPPGNEICLDLPVIPGSNLANLSFSGAGSATVTITYPDLLECVVFDAPLGSAIAMPVKHPVELTCAGDCDPLPEFCEIEVCVNFSPDSPDDVYMVEFESGAMLKITNETVFLPNGSKLPYNGTQFCAPIFIEIGTIQGAQITFIGTGEVVTTIKYIDSSGFCPIFKAGQGTSKIIKKVTKIGLGCDPIC